MSIQVDGDAQQQDTKTSDDPPVHDDDDADSSSTSTQDSMPPIQEQGDDDIQAGDHIYQWKSFAGIPGMVQHHGIVLERRRRRNNASSNTSELDEEEEEWAIVDFSVMLSTATGSRQEDKEETNEHVDTKHEVQSSETVEVKDHDEQNGSKKSAADAIDDEASSSSNTGTDQSHRRTLVRKRPGSTTLVEQSNPHNHWHKVRYQAPFWRRHLHRSGTCTAVPPDSVGMVLSRAAFLLDNPSALPPYHFLKANSECVAVWCKTNTWATLQASSFLELTAAGQVKGAGTLAMAASSTQVTVPAAGVWGWLGFTTKVSLLATQPWLVPALAGYGLLSVGGPVWMLARCKSVWNETTQRLQEELWQYALERPDEFAEHMTEWSEL